MKKTVAMKKYALVLVLFCLISITQNAFGQSREKTKNAPRVLTLENPQSTNVDSKFYLKNLKEELQGTYQIQISEPNYSVVITKQILERIQNERLQNEDVYLELDEHSKVFVPSKDNIQGANFTPLATSLHISK